MHLVAYVSCPHTYPGTGSFCHLGNPTAPKSIVRKPRAFEQFSFSLWIFFYLFTNFVYIQTFVYKHWAWFLFERSGLPYYRICRFECRLLWSKNCTADQLLMVLRLSTCSLGNFMGLTSQNLLDTSLPSGTDYKWPVHWSQCKGNKPGAGNNSKEVLITDWLPTAGNPKSQTTHNVSE